MTTTKMIARLRALRAAILEDGKIDWAETQSLLDVIRPLAAKREYVFEDYERLVQKCREDGEITPEESRELALRLDLLCRHFAKRRLKFWLTVAAIATLLLSALALAHAVVTTTDAKALRQPPTEVDVGDI